MVKYLCILLGLLCLFTINLTPSSLAEGNREGEQDAEEIEEHDDEYEDEEEENDEQYQALVKKYIPQALVALKNSNSGAYSFLEFIKEEEPEDYNDICRELAESFYYSIEAEEENDKRRAKDDFKILSLELQGYGIAQSIEMKR